jgi:hypothetical protein
MPLFKIFGRFLNNDYRQFQVCDIVVAKMDGKPWYNIRKGVNVTMMSAGVASGSKSEVATGSRLVKHKYYSNAIAKKQDVLY